MLAMDFLTSKNIKCEEIAQIYKTKSSVPPNTYIDWKLTRIFEVIQAGYLPNKNVDNGFLDLKCINSEEIAQIYKTQSSVPPRTCSTGS